MSLKNVVFILLIFFCMGTALQAQKGDIVFVTYQTADKVDPETGDYPDMPHIYALEDEGYNVIKFYNESLTFAEDATLDTLYNADLIVMGRSTPSPGYGDHKEAWNEITTPILNLELWNCRSNRLNWFDTESMVSNAAEGEIHNAIIDLPEDPVFEGYDTSAPIPWIVSPFDAVGATDAGYGTVVAHLESDGTVVFVRFAADEEFYPGSGDWPGGPRTVIGNGRDNSGAAPFDYYNFTPESEAIFLAEVARLVAISQGGDDVAEKVDTVPSTFQLSQNYPNPFNPSTTIPFQLNEKSHVRLTLVDVQGHEITTIADGDFNQGAHEVKFKAGDLAAGVYFYKMVADKHTAVKKLAIVK